MLDNRSDLINLTQLVVPVVHSYPALVLGILLIVIVIFGNVLVCLSVYSEKALKTTTNYFIVSLAFADLLLAVLVLPLFVYAEVKLKLAPPYKLYEGAMDTRTRTRFNMSVHYSNDQVNCVFFRIQ